MQLVILCLMLYMYHVHVIVYANKDDDDDYYYMVRPAFCFLFSSECESSRTCLMRPFAQSPDTVPQTYYFDSRKYTVELNF